MSDDLIPIFTRPIGDSINAVDARELHRALEVRRDFSNWIKSRITELDLVEGVDFVVIPRSPNPANGETSGFRTAVDYVLTLDTAKHIAMAERNEKGRAARDYFIKAERRLREIATSAPIHRLLDPRPSTWENTFGDLQRALWKFYGDGTAYTGSPSQLWWANAEVYRLVLAVEAYAALRALNPNPRGGNKHHQHISAEAKPAFIRHLQSVLAIAETSISKGDFKQRIRYLYRGRPMQLPLGGA